MLLFVSGINFSFTNKGTSAYNACYYSGLTSFEKTQDSLLDYIRGSNLHDEEELLHIKRLIGNVRSNLKAIDFWLRYLEPTVYKKLNGPLPVEWETEVFEKFEAPYKREGAGITLAELYLDEPVLLKDSLLLLVRAATNALTTYRADSITGQLKDHHHFYLCNRLFLLNLASIYTTGFECPDTSRVIPELTDMLVNTGNIYLAFNKSFPNTILPQNYMKLFGDCISFVRTQPPTYSNFDHFTFIKKFVNPLYAYNQALIKEYKVFTRSYVDYTLNKNNRSIFDKDLYFGQNPKGIFLRVDDADALQEIDRVGKLLYYDPILSGNNVRSCNSCHRSTEYFTDTTAATSFQFNGKDRLPRNAPTLINANFNHLVMLDGKHITLQNQVKDVLFNPTEMGSSEKEVLQKILSCKEYKKTFTSLLKYTPQETDITLDHIASAITFYYSKFSKYYSPFDDAMNNQATLNDDARKGFNLFMGKAQCGTCHFVPHFNGVKPPFVNSEFEVLGVPADKEFSKLSSDKGRYNQNAAGEMLHALRTGSLRNAAFTKPYMHNGVFNSLHEVIDFYNEGGGIGHGLDVPNQTLSQDALHLTDNEKALLIKFIHSLTEKIVFEKPPLILPKSGIKSLNKRRVGGSV